MRDPRRIQRVLGLVEHYWNAHPDLRLGQILGNAAGRDPYNYEDDLLEAQLQEWLNSGS